MVNQLIKKNAMFIYLIKLFMYCEKMDKDFSLQINIAKIEKIPRCINGKGNPEYNRLYMRIYIMMEKHWAVEKLGRKCSKCGLVSEFDCVYDFHHLEEENSWSKGSQRIASDLRLKELSKWKRADKIPEDVKLLCSNCHRIEHLEKEVEEYRTKFRV